MIRIGFIGAGGIARAHLKSLRGVEGAAVVAAADTDTSRARSFVEGTSAEPTDDYRKVLDLVDVVYICTPPTAHREQVEAAVAAGKAVFCEKPLATTLADGEAIAAAAGRSRAAFTVGFNHRFRPSVARIKTLTSEGKLGRLTGSWVNRMSPDRPGPGNWRVTPGLLCGVAVESLSHDIDLLRWWCGEVATVQGKVLNTTPELEGYDDNVSAVMTTAAGAVASFHVSWSASLRFNTRGVIGASGAAALTGPGMWGLRELRHRVEGAAEERVEAISPEEGDDMGYAAQAGRFVRCVERGEPCPVTAADGLAALKVSLAILESSRTGRAVATAPA